MSIRRTVAPALALLLVAGGCGGTKHAIAPPSGLSVITTDPPWPLGDQQGQRTKDAGLTSLPREGQFVHYHAHLDVFVNGAPVQVPAYVGLDAKAGFSPMHTHTTSGMIHIEADKDISFTLGQFLTEWGVRATTTCIGGTCAPAPMVVYVNGKPLTGSPVNLVITAATEIALVLGTPPDTIPKGYDCSLAGPEGPNCQGIPAP